jgi:hypothetical protein
MSPKLACIAAVTLTLGGVMVAFSYHAYPLPGMDSSVFVPVAVNVAAGRGLVNDVHHFLYPAPLFPTFLGAMMQEATPQGAFKVLGYLGALNVALSALLFYRGARLFSRSLTWPTTALVCLAVVSISTCFSYHICRPELLVFTIVLLLCLLNVSWPARWPRPYLWTLDAVGIGLMAFTQPNAALIFTVFLASWSAATLERRELALFFTTLAAVFTLALLILTPTMGPFLPDFASQVLAVADYVFFSNPRLKPDPGAVLDYYVGAKYGSLVLMLGPLLLLSVVIGTALYKRHPFTIKNKIAFALLASTLLFLMYATAFVYPNRIYNAAILLPPALLCIVVAMSLKSTHPHYLKYLVTLASILILVSPLNLYRNIVLFPYFVGQGVPLDEVRAFTRSIPAGEEEVLASKSLWAANDKYGALRVDHDLLEGMLRLREGGRGTGTPEGPTPTWLLLQQRDTGRTEPWARIQGFSLRHDTFIREQPRLFGVKLANTWPGYSFALYVRDPGEGEANRVAP